MSNKLPQQPTWSAIKLWVNSFPNPGDIWYNFVYFQCITWDQVMIWTEKNGTIVSIILTEGTEDYQDFENNYKSLMNKN